MTDTQDAQLADLKGKLAEVRKVHNQTRKQLEKELRTALARPAAAVPAYPQPVQELP